MNIQDTRKIPAGTPWGSVVGYSRAVRKGNFIAVAGTTSTAPDGTVLSEGDAYGQVLIALKKIQMALEELGASKEDVIRTRIYVADIESWESVGRAHGEVFAGIDPAATMVEVSRFIDSRILVEIEADAYRSDLM